MTRGLVHHIDLTVKDPEAARAFYATILGFMGYVLKDDHPRGYDMDLVAVDGSFCSIGIVRADGANANRAHDRYSPGLHHLAWTAANRADVDALFAVLQKIGAVILDPPALYPQYGPAYYAVFFADPDGLKLEYVFAPPA